MTIKVFYVSMRRVANDLLDQDVGRRINKRNR